MTETEKKRGILLTIWLALIMILNLVGAQSFFRPDILTLLDYRNAPSWLFSIYGLFGLANCIFVIFLFMWKKWAFFAYCGVAGIIVIMDFVFSSYGIFELLFSSALELGFPIVLYLIMRPKWNLFE